MNRAIIVLHSFLLSFSVIFAPYEQIGYSMCISNCFAYHNSLLYFIQDFLIYYPFPNFSTFLRITTTGGHFPLIILICFTLCPWCSQMSLIDSYNLWSIYTILGVVHQFLTITPYCVRNIKFWQAMRLRGYIFSQGLEVGVKI